MSLRALGNFLGFQVVWVLSLLGAARGFAWVAAASLLVFATWHLTTTTTLRADLATAAFATALGIAVDSLFIRWHVLSYAAPLPSDGFAPFWIVGLWIGFALTLNESMRWLHGRYMLAALLGAIGGPLSYLAGVRLGAAELQSAPQVAVPVLALAWAVAVPLLVWSTARANSWWPARA